MDRFLTAFLLAVILSACSDAMAPTSVPDAPADVRLSPRFNSIEIIWRDVSTNEELFAVEVSIDDGPFLLLGNFPENTTSAQFPDPQPAHTYRFRVSACNVAGCSAVREVSLNTDAWLKPALNGLRAATSGPVGVVITLDSSHYGRALDVQIVLMRAGDPNSAIQPRCPSLHARSRQIPTSPRCVRGVKAARNPSRPQPEIPPSPTRKSREKTDPKVRSGYFAALRPSYGWHRRTLSLFSGVVRCLPSPSKFQSERAKRCQ